MVGGAKAAGDLQSAGCVGDDEVRAAPADAIDLPIELPPQRFACLANRMLDEPPLIVRRDNRLPSVSTVVAGVVNRSVTCSLSAVVG